MARIVELPPKDKLLPDGTVRGGWWRDEPDGRMLCELCPRACRLKPGDRGFCFVRQNIDNEMVLTTYGRSTGFCIDPIEKKPLNHFYPGTSVLSFGTAGCNLGCRFCQNWDISKSREVERLSDVATPDMIARAAQENGCRSVAFTYNDPVIWAEYAIDTAAACRAVGVKTVAVTAGYITPQARAPFFHAMDAANVDLKAFTEEFYYELTASHLEPVLETLEWLHRESDVWFEITNLVIPRANDGEDEFRQMCDWILERIGPDVPIHFTAFHPDFRMRDREATPHETLLHARDIALRQGLRFAYVGNVNDVQNQSTYCPACGGLLIERNWYVLGQYHLRDNRCGHCGETIAGRFDSQPGDWGSKRQRVDMSRYQPPGGRSGTSESSMSGSSSGTLQVSEKPTNDSTGSASATMNVSSASNVPALPDLTDEEENAIHHAASEIVTASVNDRGATIADQQLAGAADKQVMGAFVTLKRQGHLRACCGSLGVPMSIANALGGAARRTALEDHRLPAISPTELPHLDLDVTLLYAFEPVAGDAESRISQIEIGTHGLQIRRGQKGGLLLPSVATEHGYDAEQFLVQVCRKAGLPTNAWSQAGTQLLRFRGHAIAGRLDADVLSEQDTRPSPRFSREDVEGLVEHCRGNLLALREGRTPNYFAIGLVDGDVLGLVLSVDHKDLPDPIQIGVLGIRKSSPLQSTLNRFCEDVARGLQAVSLQGGELDVQITILDDSAMHGDVAAPDFAGFDPSERCLAISENNRTCWRFDPSQAPESILADLAEKLRCSGSRFAGVYSFRCVTNKQTAEFSNVPQPKVGPTERPPAMAGRFYPGDARTLQQLVEQCMPAKRNPKPLPAVMAPHAGLIYSGKVAGEVFANVEIPETVIVIGPKHTRYGVSFAVAPHDVWQIPGGAVQSDASLARKIAERVPLLELDSSAHAQEHAIEVELPFIRALGPEAKVVGIVIGGATLEQTHEIADGLAELIREMEKPPLLVVSSDMNHYGTDDENRRLDGMALEALESLDTERLFQTCRDNSISMCGLLPAIITMETLKRLNQLGSAERLAYATSGDVSGDKSSVVGYAGVLFHP